jgi:hypothetical protein
LCVVCCGNKESESRQNTRGPPATARRRSRNLKNNARGRIKYTRQKASLSLKSLDCVELCVYSGCAEKEKERERERHYRETPVRLSVAERILVKVEVLAQTCRVDFMFCQANFLAIFELFIYLV